VAAEIAVAQIQRIVADRAIIMRLFIPDISFEPISGYSWKTVERQERLVFCPKAKVSKPNASEWSRWSLSEHVLKG
jgi:hypothetical protein